VEPSRTIPSRLVIRAPNWLGDAVMALPALAAVRAAMPETQIAIAAIAGVAPIFEVETTGAPDEVIAVRDRGREIELLSAGKFDAALLLTNSFRSAWTARRAGIAERWGFGGNLRGRL
jgi:heptosyltransferase-2